MPSTLNPSTQKAEAGRAVSSVVSLAYRTSSKTTKDKKKRQKKGAGVQKRKKKNQCPHWHIAEIK